MRGDLRAALTRLRERLGAPDADLIRARAREVDAALAENARLDALLEPRLTELEQAAASVAESRLRRRS